MPPASALSTERRKALRTEIAIPVRVQGFEADGSTWSESTSTSDVSMGGISFALERNVAMGQVLLLVLPLPKQLRQFDLNSGSYRIYALVRGARNKEGRRRVGVMFFGKFPPRGFQEHPGARFLLPGDAPGGPPPSSPSPAATQAPTAPAAPPARPAEPSATLPPSPPVAPSPPPQVAPQPAAPPVPGAPGGIERRKHPRYSLFMNFSLQQVDEWGAVLQEELTVADSLGKGGAEVPTTLDLAEGDVVILQETGGGFATRAEIRGVTRGADGVGRLHLKFIDRLIPDRLLERA
jgi:hypothetical protein